MPTKSHRGVAYVLGVSCLMAVRGLWMPAYAALIGNNFVISGRNTFMATTTNPATFYRLRQP